MSATHLISRLEALYTAGRHFDFLVNSYASLPAHPDDRPLAMLILRVLVELKLGGPARELFQARPVLRNAPDADRLEAMLERVAHGRRPWSVARVLFERNRAAMLACHQHLSDDLDALPSRLTGWQMHRTARGDHLLSKPTPDGPRHWGYLISASVEDERLVLPPRGQLGPTVVAGVRAGSLLDRVAGATENLFLQYSHPLYVVEPDWTRFAAWMHVADHTRLLSDPRVYWLLGDEAAAGLETLLLDEPRLSLPTSFVNQTGDKAAADPLQSRVETVAHDRDRRLQALTDALARRYAQRNHAYWARRYEKPGTVIGVTSRYTTMLQYSMRDAIAALQRAGWQTHLLIEGADHQQFTPIELCQAILEHDPDLIILIDHLRAENPYLPLNLPLLTWIQDPLANLLNPDAGRSIGPFDFICGYYKDRCTTQFDYPPEQFCSTVIPVCETVFHDRPLSPEDHQHYACDISFVSNASLPPHACLATELKNQPPQRHALVRTIHERVVRTVERGGFLSQYVGAPRLVGKTADQLGVDLDQSGAERLTNEFAYRLFDWARRQQSLQWVADWATATGRSFRLYGRGWQDHPTLSAHAAGVIQHGPPLRKANHASTLALQLIPSGYRHQRTFELLACGTLPLTRYCPTDFSGLSVSAFVQTRAAGGELDAASRFFPGLERVTFECPEQFGALANRLLTDHDYRAEILADLRAVVLDRCTYGAVMHQVIAFIQNRLAICAAGDHNHPVAATTRPAP